MKTILIVILCFCVSLAAFAQEAPPTEQEAIRIIEGFWRCIGAGDFESLGRYAATNEDLEMFRLLILSLNDEQKNILKNFNILELAEIQHRPSASGDYFYILYKDNLSNSSGLSYQFLKKINGTWRISGFN